MCLECQEIFALWGNLFLLRAGELPGHMKDSWMLVLIFFVK